MESITNLENVLPIKPVAAYLGGKSRLAKQICARIDAVPHKTYAEPFVGMGGVFLRRSKRPKAEVINDRNSEIATFFLILQRHYVAFMDMMKFQITTRAEFDRLAKTEPSTLTDLERAARFLYMQKTAFGGKVSGQCFGVASDRPARFDVSKLGPMLDELHCRLSGVTIENLDYLDFIKRYDRLDMLFYLDPPYYGGEDDYGKNIFERADFEKLANILYGIKGRFILSINDVPAIRDIFGLFDMESVSLNYSIAKSNATKAQELIISN